MHFFKVPTIIAIIISGIHSVSSFDCSSPAGNIKCECTATSVECSGVQTTVSEVEDVLNKANFSAMETVVIKMDDLKFEPDFTFENTTIRDLTLGYGLETLPSDFFRGSSSLVTLNLENNSIQDIDHQLFSSLSALEELFLDGNVLHNLTFNMFTKLTKVRHLSIARNNLREIDADVFQDLSALQTLTLNQNNFSSIGNLRMMSTSVAELNANDCSMTGALERDSFSGLPNLERLHLSRNELSEVKPHSLSALKNLDYLDLSYNSIQRLENYAFSEMKNLTSLDLKHNRISVLKETCFENLKKLVYLDLSSNSLTVVLCQYTTHFDSLEKIYLQDNRIKMFTEGAFFYSPNLQIMNITGNNLECSCSLTDSALYLIENSTMKKEDLESIPCVIPSNPPTLSSITDYKSSKCSTPLEQCKRPDDAQTGTSDEDDYDYDDYSDGTNTTSTDNDTFFPMTAESTTQSVTSFTGSLTSTNTFASPTTTASIIESTTLSTTTDSLSDTTSDISVTTESTTASLFSMVNHSTVSTTTALSVTTVPNTERTEQSTTNTTTTSIPSTEIVMTASIVETTSDIPVTTESTSASILSVMDASTFALHATTVPNTESTTQSTETTAATSIPTTELVTAENTSLFTTNVSDFKTTSNIPATDISTTKSTFNPISLMTTTVTGIIHSSVDAGDSCSSLDLSVQNVPSYSKFMVFSNFSYDGSTFCLKWTIVGDLQNVTRCAIRYTLNKGTAAKAIKCPLVSEEIKTWSFNEEIFKFCLDIYAPKKTNFCNLTLSGRTTMVTETVPFISTEQPFKYTEMPFISTEMPFESTEMPFESTEMPFISTEMPFISTEMPFKSTEMPFISTEMSFVSTEMPFKSTEMPFKYPEIVEITEQSVASPPSFSIIAINVHFNNSNLAFVSWVVNAEVPFNECNMTLTTATQTFDYGEGVFPCKNNSYRLRNVKETDIFKVCIESHHEQYGKLKECAPSVSYALESKSEQEVTDPLNSALVPLICLLILLVIIIAIIILKNIKKQESKRYNVRAEENKYDQRLKERPQSTSDQSTRFSYIARENYDNA